MTSFNLNYCFSLFKSKFSQLDSCPPELYITFILKFCESYGYFTLSQILVIFLHEEYNVSDINSGIIYGLWGASITFWGMITSCFNDYLGVRRSLLIGFSISMISNISIAFSSSLTLLYVILFGILPIGNSMGIPMLTIGIKRYTKKANRGFAYGLFYAIMNIAALVSGPVIDFFNVLICPANSSCSSTYRHQTTDGLVTGGKMKMITGNRLTIMTIVIVYIFAWFLTYFYLRDIKVTEDEEVEEGEGEYEETTEGEGTIKSGFIHKHGSSPTLNSSSSLQPVFTLRSSSDEDDDYNNSTSPSNQSMINRHRRNSHQKQQQSEIQVYSSLHVINEEGETGKDMEKGQRDVSPNSPTADIEMISHNKQLKGSNKKKQQKRTKNNHQYSRVENYEDDDDDEDSSPAAALNPMIISPMNPHILEETILVAASQDRDNDDDLVSIRLNSPTDEERQKHSHISPISSPAARSIPKVTSVYQYMLQVVTTLTFWRFCLLTLFLINLNTIFRHVDATLPTYLLRCFGENYPKGMIYSINPFMIIWLTPTVAAFTSHWEHFTMIKYGGYVSAISPFFLVFSTSTWAVVMFMIFLSLGEAIWSPRFYDYTMSVAPEVR
jgi:uncharacterized membrane protein